ncbi:MAG TPA: MYXO-CTERM sorting domain-containing protein [Anaeromyxobacteraceae bacterium]|nr:MYXO-CTERM sorting domain-containing protein [Anaeromyxobacteraceae bacterium]
MSDAGTDGGSNPSTAPSGGCGSGSGGLAAVVSLTLLAVRRVRRRLDP